MVSCVYGVICVGISTATGYGAKIIQRMVILISICNTYVIRTRCIFSLHRIIPAIGEHVVTQDALTGGNKSVRIEESADFGVVITGL